MPTEFKTLADNTVVQKFKTIGTCHWTFVACIAVDSFSESGYRHFARHEDGRLLAVLGSERLPEDLDALPAYSEERLLAVRAWRDGVYGNAYAKIVEAYPEAAVGRREYGSLSVWIDEKTGEVSRYGY